MLTPEVQLSPPSIASTLQPDVQLSPPATTLIPPSSPASAARHTTTMVVPLGPGKFYGNSLPRPRVYDEVKFSDSRVDPPLPVFDPLLLWAQEAHWTMGGVNLTRHRLQGRIEGSVAKLRAEREKIIKKRAQVNRDSDSRGSDCEYDVKRASPSSPPPAPVAAKRRRYMALIDEVDDVEEVDGEDEMENGGVRRGAVRKLGDDFDRVASECSKKSNGSPLKKGTDSNAVASRTRSRRSEDGNVVEAKESVLKGKKLKSGVKTQSNLVNRVRTSPRLSNRRLS